MRLEKLTLRSVALRAVLVPLRRKVVSKVGFFDQWPMILIDLHTNEGITGRSYLEPYLHQSLRYLIPAIHDLAAARVGKQVAPIDDFRAGRQSLNLVGYEGMSLIAVSGLDMAAWDALGEGGKPAAGRDARRVVGLRPGLQQQRPLALRQSTLLLMRPKHCWQKEDSRR